MIDVSVIVPFFNDRPYLTRCVLSVLSQNIRELILIDDGSSDGSRQVAEYFSTKDRRIKLLLHKQNKGRSAARNTGLAVAAGKWIAFCDADDYFMPRRFENFTFWDQSDADGFYNTMISMYERQTYRPFFDEPFTAILTDVAPFELLDYLIQHDNERFSLNAFVIKREAVRRIGLFDEHLSRAEDTDWIWRAAATLSLQRDHLLEPVAVRWVYRPPDEEVLTKAALSFYRKWHTHLLIANRSPQIQEHLKRKYCFFRAKMQFPSSPILQRCYRWLLRW